MLDPHAFAALVKLRGERSSPSKAGCRPLRPRKRMTPALFISHPLFSHTAKVSSRSIPSGTE